MNNRRGSKPSIQRSAFASYIHSAMQSDSAPLPRVEYVFETSKFRMTSRANEARLRLTNECPILVRPHEPFIMPTGIHFTRTPSCAFILTGETDKDVFCHTGLIDGGYRGEIQVILLNKRKYPVTLYRGELNICLSAFNYVLPPLRDVSFLTPPMYANDAGFDVMVMHSMVIPPTTDQPFMIYLGVETPGPPEPHVALALGRSGLASRGIVIDVSEWGPRGLQLKFYNYSGQPWLAQPGSRICQIVFVERRHILKGFKKCLRHRKLAPGVRFREARVHFREDTNSVRKHTHEENAVHEPNVATASADIRGTKGLGSSGF
uniref:ORF54 n=1 Tax=Human herpesvirus 8 TaxID=37296 RepID=A0A7D3UIG1_HHV8|nr:ORF54 [Human gammaherpesvirus 8]